MPPAGATGGIAVLRQLGAIARADLLDRVRRYSYFVTLAGTLYFAYLVNSGNVRLAIQGQRGVYNSAWIGTLMALSVGCLLSLIGFYLVKNTLERDRRTGVGEILAATPLARAAYTVGKALSNFLLLASILALLAVAAGVTQLLAHEETHLDLAALLLPMAALAVPPVALAAALAVLFEAVRWLRGALGNVVFFFLWTAGLSLGAIAPGGGDLLGFRLVESSFASYAPAPAGAGAAGRESGISLNIGPGDEARDRAGDHAGGAARETGRRAAGAATGHGAEGTPGALDTGVKSIDPGVMGAGSLDPGVMGAGSIDPGGRGAGGAVPPSPPRPSGIRWPGVHWTAAVLWRRLAWLGLPLAISLLAALPFSRFDPAREGGRGARGARRRGKAPPTLPEAALAGPEAATSGEALEEPDDSSEAMATARVAEPVGTALRATAATGTAGSMPARAARHASRESERAGASFPASPARTEAQEVSLRRGRPLARLASWTPRPRALNLVIAELRLMLRGRGFWWLAVGAGLWIGGLAAPAGEARGVLLALAWIWPLALWSELGARDALYGTRPLLLSAPLPPAVQCAATWAAGAGVTALAGSGVALRLALAGDGRGLLGWLAGSLFVPALALALGTLAGSPRLFEVVYLLLWYAGPMNHVGELDYTGASPAARASDIAWIYLALAAALFAVAWAVRSRPERG